jgi:hypothetical protein
LPVLLIINEWGAAENVLASQFLRRSCSAEKLILRVLEKQRQGWNRNSELAHTRADQPSAVVKNCDLLMPALHYFNASYLSGARECDIRKHQFLSDPV